MVRVFAHVKISELAGCHQVAAHRRHGVMWNTGNDADRPRSGVGGGMPCR
jgi:hypothetical protein